MLSQQNDYLKRPFPQLVRRLEGSLLQQRIADNLTQHFVVLVGEIIECRLQMQTGFMDMLQ
ncbi:hypothetical protein D3C75_1278000 [compost metagenome]